MKGREKAPINEHNLAALLGLIDMPITLVLGKPKKDNKSIKKKTFSTRIQNKVD